MPQRLQFERLAREFLGLMPGGANCVGKLPAGADGGIWSAQFLASAAPLYDMHMGVENMGPLLYSIVRFVKPLQVQLCHRCLPMLDDLSSAASRSLAVSGTVQRGFCYAAAAAQS